VGFAGIYRGKQIPKGKKSVTISLTFRDDDGTLTHENVDQLEAPIIQDLKSKLKAQLREN
jgi:phenylalanyl-tRNA synthetase beta chain